MKLPQRILMFAITLWSSAAWAGFPLFTWTFKDCYRAVFSNREQQCFLPAPAENVFRSQVAQFGQRVVAKNYVLQMPEQKLRFLTLGTSEGALVKYDKDIVSQTMALTIVEGWYADQPPPPPNQPKHSPMLLMVRVGRQQFNIQPDGSVAEANFLETQKWLLSRADSPTTFEIVYWVPPAYRNDLVRYFRDRKYGRATIGGETVVPGYELDARGGRADDGRIVENCLVFAMSFVQSFWMTDYEGLRPFVNATGLGIPEQDDRLGIPYVAHLTMNTRPVAIVVIGRNALQVGEPIGEHHWRFLHWARAIRRYRLDRENTRVVEQLVYQQ